MSVILRDFAIGNFAVKQYFQPQLRKVLAFQSQDINLWIIGGQHYANITIEHIYSLIITDKQLFPVGICFQKQLMSALLSV